MTYISWSHSYVSLLCNHERQAPIRCAPLSSDNKLLTYFEILIVPHFTLGTCSVSLCEWPHVFMPPTSKKLRGTLVWSCQSVCLSVTLSYRHNILRTIQDIGLIFGIQYPYHMKMCWLTFRQSASNIFRVIPLFVKIKCLLYLGNQFV